MSDLFFQLCAAAAMGLALWAWWSRRADQRRFERLAERLLRLEAALSAEDDMVAAGLDPSPGLEDQRLALSLALDAQAEVMVISQLLTDQGVLREDDLNDARVGLTEGPRRPSLSFGTGRGAERGEGSDQLLDLYLSDDDTVH